MPLDIRSLIPCLALLVGTAAAPLPSCSLASPCDLLGKADILMLR